MFLSVAIKKVTTIRYCVKCIQNVNQQIPVPVTPIFSGSNFAKFMFRGPMMSMAKSVQLELFHLRIFGERWMPL